MNNRNIALTEWEIAGARIVNENIFRLARNGRVFEIQDLFRGGIDPDSMDKNGNTVLIIACQNNHKDLARLCLQFRADVNWKNNLGKNALDYARQYRYDRLRDYLVRKGAVSS
jgi:ankyrin repeat protein